MENILHINSFQILNESSLREIGGGGGIAERVGYGSGYAVGYASRKFRDSIKTSRWRRLSRSQRRIPSSYNRRGR